MFFRPSTLRYGLALSWIRLDTVKIYSFELTRLFKNCFEFVRWQRGRRGENKTGKYFLVYSICLVYTPLYYLTGLQDALSDMSFSLDSSRIDNNTSLQQEQPVLLTPQAFSSTSPR